MMPTAVAANEPTLYLQRCGILQLMPQQGAMCLLDSAEVMPQRIACTARVDAVHPLAVGGVVPAVQAVEFGAQAAALHRLATLVQLRPASEARRPAGGWVLQGRDLRFGPEALDALPQPLRVDAICDSTNGEVARYRYTVSVDMRVVASGELMLLMTW